MGPKSAILILSQSGRSGDHRSYAGCHFPLLWPTQCDMSWAIRTYGKVAAVHAVSCGQIDAIGQAMNTSAHLSAVRRGHRHTIQHIFPTNAINKVTATCLAWTVARVSMTRRRERAICPLWASYSRFSSLILDSRCFWLATCGMRILWKSAEMLGTNTVC